MDKRHSSGATGPYPLNRTKPGKKYQMLVAQGFRCGMCGFDFAQGGRRAQLDHDHATGKLREMICASCNAIIGQANDSIKRLEQAIAYLRRHGKG